MKSDPIRILQYIGSLNSGGSQSMIMEIYRKIDKNKIQFDFIIDRKDETLYENEILKLGGKVYKFDNHLKGYNIIQFKKEWNDFLKKHKEYKIIHCHVRSVASIVLKIAKKYDLTTICHSHSTSNGSGFKALVKKFLQKRIVKYADYLFACSIDSAKWLYGEKMLQTNRCVIINNAIDTKKYLYNEETRNRVRKNLNLNDKIVLGQVGRLEEVKNYNFTIDLISELVKRNPKYMLLIIGTGSLKDVIVDKIAKLNLKNNVLLLENRNDVNELMQAMDVFLMPSLWEGLPLALVEAQAASLPCIISENILDGILVDDIVSKLNINLIDEWLKKIEEISSVLKTRKNFTEIIKNKGFDIENNVDIISKFYLSL